MAKIELSLKSNIGLITASGMFSFKLSEIELTPIIARIVHNFYYHYSHSIASIAKSIWTAHKDRTHVHELLCTAYDMEDAWREKNQGRTLLLKLCNPHSLDIVPINQIVTMQVPSQLELRNKLACLSEEEFESTPYFKSIRSTMIQFCGGECQTRINDVQCGKTEDLVVHYMTRENARGKEHMHYKSDLTIICRDCQMRHYAGDPSGELCRKVGIRIV
jgi:hypothetical protein